MSAAIEQPCLSHWSSRDDETLPECSGTILSNPGHVLVVYVYHIDKQKRGGAKFGELVILNWTAKLNFAHIYDYVIT